MILAFRASLALCLALLSIDPASAKYYTVTVENVVTQTVNIPPATVVKTSYVTQQVTPPPVEKVEYVTKVSRL